jgi:hypothetical protein
MKVCVVRLGTRSRWWSSKINASINEWRSLLDTTGWQGIWFYLKPPAGHTLTDDTPSTSTLYNPKLGSEFRQGRSHSTVHYLQLMSSQCSEEVILGKMIGCIVEKGAMLWSTCCWIVRTKVHPILPMIVKNNYYDDPITMQPSPPPPPPPWMTKAFCCLSGSNSEWRLNWPRLWGCYRLNWSNSIWIAWTWKKVVSRS